LAIIVFLQQASHDCGYQVQQSVYLCRIKDLQRIDRCIYGVQSVYRFHVRAPESWSVPMA
jgi:hypothetical protein